MNKQAISNQSSALDMFLSEHDRNCEYGTRTTLYMMPKACTCGRDKAAAELREMQEVVNAARGLVAYRQSAGTLNFQLEKADHWINKMRNALDKESA